MQVCTVSNPLTGANSSCTNLKSFGHSTLRISSTDQLYDFKIWLTRNNIILKKEPVLNNVTQDSLNTTLSIFVNYIDNRIENELRDSLKILSTKLDDKTIIRFLVDHNVLSP